MKILRTAAAAAALLSTAALAQPTTPAPAPAPAPAAAPAAEPVVLKAVEPTVSNVLPSNSEVVVALTSALDSHDLKVGDPVKLTVARDVMMGTYVVIPRGTPAQGEITSRTGRGVFGKSAKMEMAIRAIQLNGKSIPVSGEFKQKGSGNTGATLGAVALAGVVGGLFVKGRSATLPAGHEFKVYTKEAVPVEVAPKP